MISGTFWTLVFASLATDLPLSFLRNFPVISCLILRLIWGNCADWSGAWPLRSGLNRTWSHRLCEPVMDTDFFGTVIALKRSSYATSCTSILRVTKLSLNAYLRHFLLSMWAYLDNFLLFNGPADGLLCTKSDAYYCHFGQRLVIVLLFW